MNDTSTALVLQQDFAPLLEEQRQACEARRGKDPDNASAHRAALLLRLRDAIRAEEDAICAALHADLRKPAFEAHAGEIAFLYAEIHSALRALKKWMKPARVRTPLMLFPSRCFLHSEPLGQVLIIGPWNFPLQLLLAPLVGALAAGNHAVVKPSPLAPATARVLSRIVARAFSCGTVLCVEGGAETVTALLRHRFDLIFFTGGKAAGTAVARAAAETLTPCVLELGGKSPCIVDDGAHIDTVARRIAWGKFANAGQTCVAPDYLLVREEVAPKLVGALREAITGFFGSDPRTSPDYARVPSAAHADRLAAVIGKGRAACGGEVDRADRYVAPTLLAPEDLGSARLPEDEIFGPVLPICTYRTLDEAIGFVKSRPHPLALYVFSGNKQVQDRVLSEVPFGGGCVNNTLVHAGNPRLPFGGRGESGYGAYHGKTGFDIFSHRKSVVRSGLWFDVREKYAPYGNRITFLKSTLGRILFKL